MKITIDTDAAILGVETAEGGATHDLYSKEAFDVVAELWVRLGWVRKYSYGFSWMGRPIIQLPDDMLRIQEAIWQIRPDVIVETGIAHGGSLVFYASLMELIGKGRVIGIDIDIRPHNRVAIEAHPMVKRITMIEGSSIDPAIVERVRSLIGPTETVMLILDSNHERAHVAAELDAYADLVTEGSYILSQDGVMKLVAGMPRTKADWDVNNPITAVEAFLAERPDFELLKPPRPFDETSETPDCSHHPVGWLRRRPRPGGAAACPVCGGPALSRSVRRDALPIIQNIVYDTRDEAVACPRASLTIGTCEACGFSFNADFDPAKIVYDSRYDNHVASAVFDAYYRTLARQLIDRFELDRGTVYDIGCGSARFLKILCELAPDIRGVGIDPSCRPLKEGRLEMIAAPFSPDLFGDDARLVLCRHVLEHIHRPVEFLSQLREGMPAAPLFVEVPDLHWTVENEAFWDFCYEHCNYFTPATLAAALTKAGFVVEEQGPAFGDQFLWAIGRPGPAAGAAPKAGLEGEGRVRARDEVARLRDYAEREAAHIAQIRGMADEAGGLVLWGMATKGVILSNLIGAERVLRGIDMNAAKQERFAPGSGVRIEHPRSLADAPPGSTVIAMNPNYGDEIAALLKDLGLDLRLATLRSSPAGS